MRFSFVLQRVESCSLVDLAGKQQTVSNYIIFYLYQNIIGTLRLNLTHEGPRFTLNIVISVNHKYNNESIKKNSI